MCHLVFIGPLYTLTAHPAVVGVDVLPPEGIDTIVPNIHAIIEELQQYNTELAKQERWLVFNKIDLLPADERETYCGEIQDLLGWKGRVYMISAATREGCEYLTREVMNWLERQREKREASSNETEEKGQA